MSIEFNQIKGLFSLKTTNSLYQMKINEIGLLQHIYYGAKIEEMDMSYRHRYIDRGFSGNPYEKRLERSISFDLLPQEYTSSGIGDYRISSIEASAFNGSQSVDFRYVSHAIYKGKYPLEGLPAVRANADPVDSLEIILEDRHINLAIKLLYSVFSDKDVITRSVQIINKSAHTVTLNKVASASIDFPFGKKELIHFHGRHCMERQVERVELKHNICTVASKRGMSSHHQNPFVILCDPETGEDSGNCYGFMMVYSGNHKTEVEVDQSGSTRLVMGINDAFFSWQLTPGTSFDAPEVILSYSDQGLNALSHQYHKIIKENIIPLKYQNKKRPILINNWEATYFDFNTQKILELAQQAKDLGIEMLVLDDGWFKNRNDDNAGLGDWLVDEEKLEGGIAYIAKAVKQLGLKFGLWFEPEMVNEDSDLFRQHPDWALSDPERLPMLSRNQLVLDMSRQEVVDYLFERMSQIIQGSDIDYIKWDFNRALANVYSRSLDHQQQGEVAHRFILGTYQLMERLTTRFPEIMIEGCAGGGGRFDAGILYYSPQIWTSDDTDPIERLQIQKGTSYGYPVSSMGSHVSASPNHQTGRKTPLDTRGVVAMSGTFGYELDLNQLTDADKCVIQKQVETFHRYYWLIQEGLYYRISDQEDEKTFTAWSFVSPDKSEFLLNMVVTHVHANPQHPYVKLKGLDPSAVYRLEGTEDCYSGQALMQAGYVFKEPKGIYPAEQLHFIKIN